MHSLLAHSSHNLCHIWSLATALCFWGLSGCHLCVWEVRFIGFGPGRCPSCALRLTQTMASRDGVIQRVEAQLYNGNSQTKLLTCIKVRAPKVKCVITREEAMLSIPVCWSVNCFYRLLCDSLLNTEWLLVRLQKRAVCLNGEKTGVFGLTTCICA